MLTYASVKRVSYDWDNRRPVLTIGTVAELTGLSQKQLRVLESRGIVAPLRTETSRRLYSTQQLAELRYISYLIRVRGTNAAGVIVALELLDRLPDEVRSRVLAEAEVARMALDAREPIVEVAKEFGTPPD